MDPRLLFWFLLLTAPFVGSFLGVLASRLPENRPVGWARSSCDACGHVLATRDLLPFASFLLLKGRCRYCGGAISAFAPAMELAAAAVVVWAGFETDGWLLAASCLLGWMLVLLAVIDWRTQILPNVVTLPLLVVGLMVGAAIAPGFWMDRPIGVAAGFLVLFLLSRAYARLRGREGLGLGDAKMLAAIGAWVSWQGLPSVLLWASILGLSISLARAIARGGLRLSERLPFGVFLAAGAWIVWLYGPLAFSTT